MALRPQLREGGLWLGSRATNGVLGLAQVSLTAAAIGPHEAGRFFLLWTGSWLLATVLKFGTDGILPRVVAEAHLAGRDVPSLLRPLAAGAAAFALLLVPLLAVFRVPIGGASIAGVREASQSAYSPYWATPSALKSNVRLPHCCLANVTLPSWEVNG